MPWLWTFLLLLLLSTAQGLCQTSDFAARNGNPDAPVLTVYSSLDLPLASPLILGFQERNPTIAVKYEHMLTGDVFGRVVSETDGGKPTADLALSSAMDLQVKLANDGYAQEAVVPASTNWPRWANWRNTAYALTFEPAVFVYYKPAFTSAAPPSTRSQFVEYLRQYPDETLGRVATYDIQRSGVGFMLMARDQEQFPDIWSTIGALGEAKVQLFPTSQEILERIADGRALLGYNILGSYAADWANKNPAVGVLLPEDYTVVMSRIGLVPKAAANPGMGRLFLEYCMSVDGQSVMATQMHIGSVNPQVGGSNSLAALQDAMGAQLRPVPVSPGLLVYLDQVKRKRLIGHWKKALGIE